MVDQKIVKKINYVMAHKYILYRDRLKTRLHSSRMHTTRWLTVSPSMLCWGGGACLVPGAVPAWSGGTWLGGLPSWSKGGKGVPAWSWGVGWYPSMHWDRPHHGQNSWHTLLKILRCPKHRLRAVIRPISWSLFKDVEACTRFGIEQTW